GSQFPVEAYDNYMKQTVPRWLSTDRAVVDAYIALVDKICPCVLLLHSQGGAFGFKVAEQRPTKVKAIVAVESASAGDLGKAVALKDTPTLMLFGDYVDQHSRWAAYKKIDLEYAQAIRRRLYRPRGQGLSLRCPGAQPVGIVRLQSARGAARQGQGGGGGGADGGGWTE